MNICYANEHIILIKHINKIYYINMKTSNHLYMLQQPPRCLRELQYRMEQVITIVIE